MRRMSLITFIALAVAALALPASAQMAGCPMMQGQDGMQMMCCPMCPIHGMAGESMTVDGNFIYILRGNQLLKINKNNMQLVGTTDLPQAPMQRMAPTPGVPGAPGAPGRGPAQYIRPAAQNILERMQMLEPAAVEENYLQTIIDAHAGAIEWSRLAVARAEHPELRQFAQNVIQHEQELNQEFATYLQRYHNVTPVASPLQIDQQVLNRLQTLEGDQFDQAYIQAMLSHFAEAVALTDFAVERMPHDEVRQTAANMAAEHRRQIQQLESWMQQWYGMS